MDSPHEVIYFNVRFVMSDNPSQESRRGTYYTNFFNDVNPETNCDTNLKFLGAK